MAEHSSNTRRPPARSSGKAKLGEVIDTAVSLLAVLAIIALGHFAELGISLVMAITLHHP
jgi:hypothetical protein